MISLSFWVDISGLSEYQETELRLMGLQIFANHTRETLGMF